MRCTVTGTPYTVFGYEGKQVRDNIHAPTWSRAFGPSTQARAPARSTTSAAGARANCSMLEAIALIEEITGRRLELDL